MGVLTRLCCTTSSCWMWAVVAFTLGCDESARQQKQEVASTPSVVSRAEQTTKKTVVVDAAQVPEAILQLRRSDRNVEGRPLLIISVRNSGNMPFAWDRRFATFMKWNVASAAGVPFSFELLDSGHKPNTDVETRFPVLAPGQEAMLEVDLFGSLDVFACSRALVAANGESHVVPVGSESQGRFQISDDAQPAVVHVEYIGTDMDVADGFAVYFQQRPEKIGLPRIAIKSDPVTVPLNATINSP